MTWKQLRFAVKHHRTLWKYRKLIRNRKQILVFASLAGAAILASALLLPARNREQPVH